MLHAGGFAGGLVGYNFQILSNAYSNSAVSGPLYVGGAVGLNNIAAGPTAGLMSQVYATGAVTGTGASPSAVGGLVGFNGNSITQSYWDSYTTGQAAGVGSGTSSARCEIDYAKQSGGLEGFANVCEEWDRILDVVK